MKKILKQSDEDDKKLIKEALGGSKTALELLLKGHYDFIYNVAFRFVFNHDDAQDLTQDVIIKVITNLSQFNHQANFRTWLYRIVFNHFLNTKKRKMEFAVVSFDEYGKALDNIPDIELNKHEQSELQDKVEDAKIGCMTGMLLCLEREQRLIYTLGEIFDIESKTGAELLNISADNFRQILSRARKTLYNYMNNKCGLINTNNPCRCHKKTKGFIQVGWVNESNLHFNNHFINHISIIATKKSNQFDNWMDDKYGALFKEHPYYDQDKSGELINQLIDDNDFQKLFELN